MKPPSVLLLAGWCTTSSASTVLQGLAGQSGLQCNAPTFAKRQGERSLISSTKACGGDHCIAASHSIGGSALQLGGPLVQMDQHLAEVVAQKVQAARSSVGAGASGSSAGRREVSGHLLPHLNHVFLDSTGDGRQVLTHMVTGEKLALPTDTLWQLHFDDACFGCCIANDPSRGPVCVEDLCAKMVFLSTGGTYLVADKAFPERAIDLSTFAAKHEELTLVLLIGPSKSKKTLDAALVR